MKGVTLTVIMVALVLAKANSTIINIPDDYPTIQEGIDHGADGDTVLVQPDTYYENLDFNSHNIVLGSMFLVTQDTAYIWNTIIDGDSAGSVITFENGEDSTAQVVGFTIQNGYAGYSDYGGGIGCRYSSPTIRSNIIKDNGAEDEGGGVYCYHSDPAINRNIIVRNSAKDWGGGVYCHQSSPRICNNAIAGNSVDNYDGGGICCRYSSSPTVSDNAIRNNLANDVGGGISCFADSDALISRNDITGNLAKWGGGIYCQGASPTISSNNITDNWAENSGGGIACEYYSSPTISNNIISCNSAIWHGAGVYCYTHSSPTIRNVTISRNWAHDGGGVYCDRYSSPTIMNTILWADTAADCREIYVGYECNPTVTYSDIEGGWPGEGNIDADPLFRDPEAGDFHLMADYCGDPSNSPCIDAGHPDSLDALLDCFHGLGTERVDMGAYGGFNSGWPTSVDDDENNGLSTPRRSLLRQNYPNPFNARTTIGYELPVHSSVRLEIYNILGHRVANLVHQGQEAGYKSVDWNASDYASGVYFYRLTAGDFTEAKRMMLIK